MSPSQPARVAGILLLVLVVAVTPVAAVGPAEAMSDRTPRSSTVGSTFASSHLGNTTPSTPHVPPGGQEANRDLEAVEDWLEIALRSRFNASIQELEHGQFASAREPLSDGLPAQLELYRVAVIESGEDADETIETYETAARLQLRLIDDVETYRRTLGDYRNAKRTGDESRAGRLASELGAAAASVNQTATELVPVLVDLRNRTQGDFSREIDAVSLLEDNATDVRTALPDSHTPTALTVQANRSLASPIDPVTIEGQLLDANGTPIANQEIDVEVGEQRIPAQTDGNGSFALRYRPTAVPAGVRSIEVRYAPAIESPWLGSGATVTLTVQAIRPDVTVQVQPAIAGYGDTLLVSGGVEAGSIGLSGVPVAVSIGPVELGQVETDTDGRYALETSIPAGLDVGIQEIEARLATEGTAVRVETVSGELRISPTDTLLTATATPLGPDQVHLAGRLTTGAGQPVSGGRIVVESSGGRVATATTDSEGEFATVIQAEGLGEGPQRVSFSFQPTGTSLEPADATVELVERSAGRFVLGSLLSVDRSADRLLAPGLDPETPAVVGWLLVGIAAVALGAWVHRRRDGAAFAPTAIGAAREPITRPLDAVGIDPDRLLEYATEQLAAGRPNLAVIAAYASLRQPDSLGSAGKEGLTHWEFVSAVEHGGLNPEEVQSLRTVTDRAERAAFDPRPISDTEAGTTITLARGLLRDR